MSAFQAPPGMQSPIYGADFSVAIVRLFRKALVFVGRSSRSEYWWGLLGLVLANIAISILQSIILGPAELLSGTFNTGVFSGLGNLATMPLSLLSLALMVPQLALSFRRMHDANYSGWFGLLILIPGLGWIASIVLGFLPTVQNTRYETTV